MEAEAVFQNDFNQKPIAGLCIGGPHNGAVYDRFDFQPGSVLKLPTLDGRVSLYDLRIEDNSHYWAFIRTEVSD